MSRKLLVSNIQRFSLHDGPGIRTTVFLMGCTLHCPWCSNPENRRAEIQRYVKDGREGTIGKRISAEELTAECLKDRDFYVPGGVTFSGGEPLLQAEALIPVCEALHGEGIHLAAETSLFLSEREMELALASIDLFLADVKILDEKRAEETEGGALPVYLRNLERLMKTDRQVILRIPLIRGYTDDEENRRAVVQLLGRYRDRILKAELIPGHDLAASKYSALGLVPAKSSKCSEELLSEYRKALEEAGVRL